VRARLCRGRAAARLTALQDRSGARRRQGYHAQRLDELTGLVARDPVRERLVGQLMLALYRSGMAGEALRVYQQARRRLADELGLDPGAELRRLELEILRGTPAAD